MSLCLRRIALCLCLLLNPAVAGAAGVPPSPAPPLRVGVLTDMTGSMADASGMGSVEAAQLAVDAVGGVVGGAGRQRAVTILHADYQNRSDLANRLSVAWLAQQRVDVLVDVPSTAIAVRMQNLLKAHDKMLLTSSASSAIIRHAPCHAVTLAWLYDRETLTRNLVQVLGHADKKRWFIVNNEENYSQTLSHTAQQSITASGGVVVGEAQLGKHMQGLKTLAERAAAAKADALFLAFDRSDVLYMLGHWPTEKTPGAWQQAVPLVFSGVFITDLHSLAEKNFGKTLPRFYTMATFYWNEDAGAQAWANQFALRNRSAMPSEIHANLYAALFHYLSSRTSETPHPEAGGAHGIWAAMQRTPLSDSLFQGDRIRADGLVLHPLFLLELKPTEARQNGWDYFTVLNKTEAKDLVLPPEESCLADDSRQSTDNTNGLKD